MFSMKRTIPLLLVGFFCILTSLQAAPSRSVVLLPGDFNTTLAYLAQNHYDIAGADWRSGTIEVITDDEGLRTLKAVTEPQFTILSTGSRSNSNLDLYTDPEEMETFLYEVQAAHPDIAMVVPISDVLWEGHVVYAMKISDNVTEDEDEPVFLLDGQHHAREVMTSEITKDAIDYLTSRYDDDPQVKRWVDNLEIWVVPIVNPDGAAYVHTNNNMWRKNRHPGCPVDNNRNYPTTWNACNGSSSFCSAEDYRGEGPASEPENQAMDALFEQIRPVFYLTYHSYGTYIIWPLGCHNSPENNTLRRVGAMLNLQLEDDSGRTGRYKMGTSTDTLYETDGTSDDEAYAHYGTFTYTIEVNSYSSGGFLPDYTVWRDITVERQRAAWQFFLDYLLDDTWLQTRVHDSLTGRPVHDATLDVDEVPLDPQQVGRNADRHGRIFFIPQPGQTYHLTFSAPGHQSVTTTITAGNTPINLTINLAPRMTRIDNPLPTVAPYGLK